MLYYDILFIKNYKILLISDGIALKKLSIRLNDELNFNIDDNWILKRDIFYETRKQLVEYLIGIRQEFSIPFAQEGTNFQHHVWTTLMNIKYGQTVSYSDVSKTINKDKAQRAVGQAISKNQIPIIIPCHRVISKNNKIGGYNGNLEIKKQLLTLEHIPNENFTSGEYCGMSYRIIDNSSFLFDTKKKNLLYYRDKVDITYFSFMNKECYAYFSLVPMKPNTMLLQFIVSTISIRLLCELFKFVVKFTQKANIKYISMHTTKFDDEFDLEEIYSVLGYDICECLDKSEHNIKTFVFEKRRGKN